MKSAFHVDPEWIKIPIWKKLLLALWVSALALAVAMLYMTWWPLGVAATIPALILMHSIDPDAFGLD